MAHTLSAKKRMRQSAKLRERNRSRKRTLRQEVKKLDALVVAKDTTGAAAELKTALKVLDRVASKGTLHPNTVARRKSKLAKKVNALKAAPKA